ncbi:hypothetical protein BDFB_014314, partial [Asbolus verrucosus]
MEEVEAHTTEWALLFPLRAGMFAMKSSSVTRSVDHLKKKAPADSPDRLRMRRGSSMSELDKMSSSPLPDLVRSTTANQHLGAGPASLPHSPHLSRSFLSSTTVSVRGSIGDLMNQKKYGSSQWSVRSETLIARTVPLSTVTPRQSPSPLTADLSLEGSLDEVCGPLTAAQRTKKLSRLIRQQRSAFQKKTMAECLVRVFVGAVVGHLLIAEHVVQAKSL